MKMEALKQTEFLIRYIRESKRKVIAGAIAASVISVLLFVLGSYYLLFRFYERMTGDYYTSLLHGVSSFQSRLIESKSYGEDLKSIAARVKRYRGVNHVWFSDRFGRLIYSTDPDLLAQYRQKRLPSLYFESVKHLWRFENGNPVPKVVQITRFLSQRYSIPIYAYEHEEYDYVMGIDVRRFVYIPEETERLILMSAGYIAVFVSLLFFPLFFLVTSRFGSLTARAPMMMGMLKPVPEKTEAENEAETLETPSQEAADSTSRDSTGPTPQAEVIQKEEVSEPVQKEEKVEEEEQVVEKEVPDNDLALFVKRKKEIFMREDIQLQFIHASSYIHHSIGIEGTYIYTHRSGKKVYFISFVQPAADAGGAMTKIYGLISLFNEQIEASTNVKDFTGRLNAFCLQKKMGLDLSVVAIDIEEKSVRYGSFGSGRAIYLKKGEDEIKQLLMDSPGLGSLAEKEFGESTSYADIRFAKDDLFVMLPQNIVSIDGGPDGLLEALKKDLLEKRDQTVFDLSSGIGGRFEALTEIQQSGFVVVKFV